MNEDGTPINDDDAPVVDETVEEVVKTVEEPTLSQAELDALPDVPGSLTPNEDLLTEDENVEPAKSEPPESEVIETEEEEQPTGSEIEEDEAGVFQNPTTEDPGDFKPGDHSFTVTINGKRTTVSSIEQADSLAEDPEAFKDAKQLIRFMDKRSDMRTAIKDDRKVYDDNKVKYDQEQQLAEVRDTQLKNWANEFDYLTKRGDIPAVKPELDTGEAGLKWATDHKDEPGVKERLEIMKYMDDESKNRQAAGLPPMTSMLEAYNEMQVKNLKSDTKTRDDQAVKDRQARGSRVSGPAPYVPGNTGSGEIVGSPGTLNDLVNEILLNG